MQKNKNEYKQLIEEGVNLASLDGCMRLIEAVILGVIDKISIPKSWHRKKISARMIEKKRANLEEIGKWMKTDNAKIWYTFYEIATLTEYSRIRKRIERAHRKGIRTLNKLSSNL